MIKLILINHYRVFCSLICLGMMVAVVFTESGKAYGQQNNPGNQFTLSTFANGQKFVIQKDSFTPIGGGKLQYQVTEDTGPSAKGKRVSVNEVDCNTGQYRSPVESWYEDASGGVSQQQPGPPFPMQVSNRTPLYDQLKSSCQEQMPDLPIKW